MRPVEVKHLKTLHSTVDEFCLGMQIISGDEEDLCGRMTVRHSNAEIENRRLRDIRRLFGVYRASSGDIAYLCLLVLEVGEQHQT